MLRAFLLLLCSSLLLGMDVPLERSDENLDSQLYEAIVGNMDTQKVRELLSAGANSNFEINGSTILVHALLGKAESAVIAELISAEGFDIRLSTLEDGTTALAAAFAIGASPEVINLLLNCPHTDINKEIYETSLLYDLVKSCLPENNQMALYLLQLRSLNVLVPLNRKSIVLHEVVWNHFSNEYLCRLVRLCIAQGAHPDTVDPDGKTALHKAVLSGSLETVTLLANRSADVKRESKYRHLIHLDPHLQDFFHKLGKAHYCLELY